MRSYRERASILPVEDDRGIVEETLADDNEQDLPQTMERSCPACASERIERIGLEHAINFGVFRTLHRCVDCEGLFLLTRPRSRWALAAVTARVHRPGAASRRALR